MAAKNTTTNKPPEELVVPARKEPLYKIIAGKSWQSLTVYAGIFLLLLLGGLIVYERTHKVPLAPKAAAGTATFTLQPVTQSVPPETQFQVWMTADQPVAFVQFELSFNPTLLKMTREFSWVNTALTRVVKITTMADANISGKVDVTVALDPANRANPPTGTFQVGTIALSSNTALANQTATVNFTNSFFQVVNPDSTLFTVTGTGATIGVNVTPTTTPTPTPTPASSPTPIPTPNTNDTTPPVVTISSPVNGSTIGTKGTVKLSATASDSSGISKIDILLDTQIMATCNAKTSCSTNVNVNKFTSGSHTITARATDGSANHNIGTTSVTVTKP